MLIIQFVDPINISTFPVEIIQTFRHNTYLVDCQLNEHDIINSITSKYTVLSMQSNTDLAYFGGLNAHTASYTHVLPESTLAPLIEKLDLLEAQNPQILCFDWQIDRNYILDFRIKQLVKAGNIVVCSGGNNDVPLLDLSPVAVDGVFKVGGHLYNNHYANWIDVYDFIVADIPNSDEAVHYVCKKLVTKELELEYNLGFYSDSTIRSAPWPQRLVQSPTKIKKYYEFFPVSNLRYFAGEHLLPVRPGDDVSVKFGSIPLKEFTTLDIDVTESLPRGITFNTESGWLYGTFKFREDMFHRIVATINGQEFEYHIISCDADNKISYEQIKQSYFNRPYDAPPFNIREYWVPMSRPVKLLEPGDPFIRTYNLNDLHLYRSYE